MRVAALYDIHGNLPALEAVLQEIEESNIDQIVIGGDVIVGPMSRECLDKLLEISIPIYFIQGNCEISVLDEMKGNLKDNLPENVLEDIRWTASQLLVVHQELMAKWPKTITLNIEGLGKVLFCHATPRNEDEIFTRLTSEEKLLPIFQNLNANIVVCGHTHMQFDRHIGKVRVINAGSVGMPFGKRGAYWLLIDDSNIELCRTDYDYKIASKQIIETNYPSAKDFAEKNMLHPSSEGKMLRIFNHAELK